MTDEPREPTQPFIPPPGTPGWDAAPAPYRDRPRSQPLSTGSKVAIAVAVVFALAGLAMIAFVLVLFSALSSWGSNK
jgi:hypothetical protein